MDYTAEQYEMLERFEAGVNITTFTEDEKVIFWFLDGNKLLQAHSDIEDGLFDLSQQGKCVLESHREAILKAKQQAEQAAQKKEDDENKSVREHRFQYRLAIFSFLLGLASGHAPEIWDFISEKVIPWFCSLFH